MERGRIVIKKTEWYPGDVAPARKGVYERDFGDLNREDLMSYWTFSYWDGRRWYVASISPETNLGMARVHFHQELPWRGLAREPK